MRRVCYQKVWSFFREVAPHSRTNLSRRSLFKIFGVACHCWLRPVAPLSVSKCWQLWQSRSDLASVCFCLTSLATCLSCELAGSRTLYVSSYPTRCQSFVFDLVQPSFQTWEPCSLISRPSCWLFCLVGGWWPSSHVALHPRLLTLVMSPRLDGVVWLKPVVCARGLILTGKTQQHQTPERQQSGTLSLTV